MRQNVFFTQLLCLLLMVSCGNKEKETEKVQSIRGEVVDVSSKVKEIDTGDVLIGASCRMYVGDGYWMVTDFKAYDTKECMIKAYLIVEVEGQLFTIYSDSINRSVAYLKGV